MPERIFVTGAGMISALGTNKAEALDALHARRTGIAPLTYLNTSHREFPVGEVKMTNQEMRQCLHIPDTAISTRTSLMGMIAVEEALKEARIGQSANGLRLALISGTTVGGMDMSEQFYLDFLANDTKNA
jgi:3-oxoacyl-[acyl-carrier-protein] synthase-1